MYDIAENEIDEFLNSIKAKDPRAAFINAQVHDYKKPKNVPGTDINPENIPDGMIYGEVEFHNSSEGILYQNVEAHRDAGWEDVYIYNHPELTSVSKRTREQLDKTGYQRRNKNQYEDFDPDEHLIKRKGLLMMQKDLNAQRAYEYDLHEVTRSNKKNITQDGFNSLNNEFGMKIKIERDTQESLPRLNTPKLFDHTM
jgi:hypothetical protein